MVVYSKVEYFSAFIKFKTPYNIKHIFEDVETPIQITIRFNHSMVLITRGGYIGRAYLVYGVKQDYEQTLRNCYAEEYGTLVEINVRRHYIVNGVQNLCIFVDKNLVEVAKETFIKRQEDFIAKGVYVVPIGNYSDIQAINYKTNML